ncbi:hypothetical protein PR048_009812 [Dryococelus australis]|uniref:Uncharacterized protein n=1 Tax=Dryococelus australis TaxID=614101 RepID=A0ABQ9I1X5_9NEOP|nr:hypothetical protein PR048_009812 [Dryococelus australis]
MEKMVVSVSPQHPRDLSNCFQEYFKSGQLRNDVAQALRYLTRNIPDVSKFDRQTSADRSVRSPPTKANRVQSPGRVTGFSQAGIVPDDAVGRGVFSGIYRFPRPSIPAPPLIQSPSSALKTSMLSAAVSCLVGSGRTKCRHSSRTLGGHAAQSDGNLLKDPAPPFSRRFKANQDNEKESGAGEKINFLRSEPRDVFAQGRQRGQIASHDHVSVSKKPLSFPSQDWILLRVVREVNRSNSLDQAISFAFHSSLSLPITSQSWSNLATERAIHTSRYEMWVLAQRTNKFKLQVENAACQLRTLCVAAITCLMSVAVSSLSLSRFSASDVENLFHTTNAFKRIKPILMYVHETLLYKQGVHSASAVSLVVSSTKATWVQSPTGPLQIFTCRNRAGRCRWSAGFLGDLPLPLPLHSGATTFSSHSSSSALKTSMSRAVQISSLIFYKQFYANIQEITRVLANPLRLQERKIMHGDMHHGKKGLGSHGLRFGAMTTSLSLLRASPNNEEQENNCQERRDRVVGNMLLVSRVEKTSREGAGSLLFINMVPAITRVVIGRLSDGRSGAIGSLPPDLFCKPENEDRPASSRVQTDRPLPEGFTGQGSRPTKVATPRRVRPAERHSRHTRVSQLRADADNRSSRISRHALDVDALRRNLLHPNWLPFIATHHNATLWNQLESEMDPPRPRSRSEGAIRATLIRTSSASSPLRARRAVFPSWRCTVQIRRTGFDFRRVRYRIFTYGKRPGRCRWSTRFLEDLPFPLPLHSAPVPNSSHFTLIGSQDLGVTSRPNLSTLFKPRQGRRLRHTSDRRRGKSVSDVLWVWRPIHRIGGKKITSYQAFLYRSASTLDYVIRAVLPIPQPVKVCYNPGLGSPTCSFKFCQRRACHTRVNSMRCSYEYPTHDLLVAAMACVSFLS